MPATEIPFAPRAGSPPGRSGLPVAVLGAGITGLSAAWQLRQRQVPVVVFEARDRPGGAIDSVREGEWLWETGPNTLFQSAPEAGEVLASLQLSDRAIETSPAAQQRYVVRAGRPVPLPTSPLGFVTTPLISWAGKLAAGGEPFRGRGDPAGDESVADFVLRRLGREFLDYIVNPFVAGIYAGDPARLSVRHAFPKLFQLEQRHRSLLLGALRRRSTQTGPRGRMLSFPHGLAELPRALAYRLGAALRLRHEVQAVRRTPSSWVVRSTADGVGQEGEFSAVISALPPDELAALRLDGPRPHGGLGQLRFIPQPAVASVFLGFRRADVAHPLDGFGVLAPEVERRRILGTLFSSTLFPGRAPAGHVAFTTFVGGARQPALATAPDPEIFALVRDELRALLGVTGSPVIARIHRTARAIPQYAQGFQEFKDACDAFEAATPGFLIAGTCRDGVSLASCLAAGIRVAAAAERHLAAP